MKNFIKAVVIIVIVLLISQSDLLAQGCVQCRMGPSSNLEHGGNVAKGINSGILYLMLIPYLLIMSIVGYVFRKPLSEKWEWLKSYFNKKAVSH